MKYFRTLTLAAAVTMASTTGATQADEIDFNAPDINKKLSVLVEEKMNNLARKAEVERELAEAIEATRNELKTVPAVTREDTDYITDGIRSKVL